VAARRRDTGAGKLTIAKLDIDANPKIPARYNVIGAPTLNLYKNGEVVQQIVSAKPKRRLLAAIEPHL
jgi:thioredoxin 1